MAFDTQEVVQGVLQAFAETPMGKWIADKMQAEQLEAQQAAAAASPSPGAPPNPQAGEQPPAQQPAQAPPAFGGDDDDDDEDSTKMSRTTSTIRMERDELALKLSRLEDQLHAEREARIKQEKKATRSERERSLTQLQAQGFQFKRAEELDDCEGMTDAQFGKHVNRIKTRYQRAPINQRVNLDDAVRVRDGGDEPEPAQFSREDVEAAQELMRREKIDFSVARERILAEKK